MKTCNGELLCTSPPDTARQATGQGPWAVLTLLSVGPGRLCLADLMAGGREHEPPARVALAVGLSAPRISDRRVERMPVVDDLVRVVAPLSGEQLRRQPGAGDRMARDGCGRPRAGAAAVATGTAVP